MAKATKKMPMMMPMKSGKPAKMAGKAAAKGKKMMPAFMKKGMK